MSIKRSRDAVAVQMLFDRTPALVNSSDDMISWVKSPMNVTLEEDGNFGLFTYNDMPGIYTGHYLFLETTRGKAAASLAKQMLRRMFDEYGAVVIRGLVPKEHKASVWMTRHIGFTCHGEVEVPDDGPCYIFTLTETQL